MRRITKSASMHQFFLLASTPFLSSRAPIQSAVSDDLDGVGALPPKPMTNGKKIGLEYKRKRIVVLFRPEYMRGRI